MSSKKQFKKFQRAAARYGLFTFTWFFTWLPYKMVRFMARVLITIGFRLTIRQRKIAEESMEIAYGDEKSKEEKQQIIKRCFENFGSGMIELLYVMAHLEILEEKVTFEGKEYLDEAIKNGKGIIAVTAHFGNFPLMMLMCAHQGYRTSSIIRQTRDEVLTDFLYKKRLALGLKTIYAMPRRQCVVSSLNELRNNGVVFVPIDQNFGGNGGIFVDFFGQKAATATGPAVFAIRTGAVILPMFMVRQDGDHHKIIIEPPIPLAQGENEKEIIALTMANITRLIEKYIRKYPHEWAWMHRRWKSRPSPEKQKEAQDVTR